MNPTALLSILLLAVVIDCATVPKGYIVNKGKAYKLMYQAKTWDNARDACVQEDGKLAVPKTMEEFEFLQRMVRGMQYHSVEGAEETIMVWLGISNQENYSVWKNVDGQDIYDTDFYAWAWGNGYKSSNPIEPHCVGIDAINPGLRDYWCDVRKPYICETIASDSTTQS